MRHIIKKTSLTNEDKVQDLLEQTAKNGECMDWIRCLNTDGYPNMFGNVKVHRWIYELSTGEDIKGRVIRHTCDNIKCINPKHLLPGTPADNVRDMDSRNRRHRVMTGEIVCKVKILLETNILSNAEIATIVGIDSRRVSDIKFNKYDDNGKFLGRS